MENNYYNLVRKLRDLKRNYKNLSIEDKILAMNLEIKIEGKKIKGVTEFQSKSEKKSLKSKESELRKQKQKKYERHSLRSHE